MDKKPVRIYMFIDALGWEIVEKYEFMRDKLPYRKKVKMQFGYSSTAIPTILSGVSPSKHGHFSFFYYDKKNSPFKCFKYLKYIFGAGLHPKCLMNRGRIRRWISKLVAKIKGYTGYFQLYGVAYDKLPYFDYCEKNDIFAKNGLGKVKNLRDILEESGLNFHISDWRKPESKNVAAAIQAIKDGVDFEFIYTADFDGFLHDNVENHSAIAEKLKNYETKVKSVLAALEAGERPYSFTIISDHGMTKKTGTVDLMKKFKNINLKFGKDYISIFDSTMLRLWYLNKEAKIQIHQLLNTPDCRGNFLDQKQKEIYGINFPDNKFGEDVFLCEAGVQIQPCDMGAKALNGMHGFSPEDKDSYACALSTKTFNVNVKEVKDFFALMKSDIDELAKNTIAK